MQRDVDVVVNCAGLVDFNPDLREALASNVDGPLAAAHFVADCKKAGLVHVSTCYVVGNREGRIEERIDYGYTPKGLDFDPTQELSEVAELVESVLAEFDTDEAEADLMAEVDRLIEKRGLDKSNETLLNNMITRTRDDRIRRQTAKVGEKRAADWGWANTYTWSKSIGEQLLQEKANALGIRWSVLRPAIVESAQEFPFEGWNEGFNTCGPLVYLLGTWFKDLPCKKGLPFDIVPVDMVCKGLLTVGAAVILGEQRAVYHCGTSDRNRFTIERATELTALGHRRHLRKHGKNTLERMVLSRWDARHVSEDYVLSMRNIRKTASGLEKGLRKLNGKFGPGPNKLANAISQADKGLKQVEKVCDLFQPFIHDNVWVFETDGLVAHDVVEEDCRFAPESIHWRTWWLDVHMPGLRKWTFPHFQGKPVPTYKPEHKFELRAPSRATTGGEFTSSASKGHQPVFGGSPPLAAGRCGAVIAPLPRPLLTPGSSSTCSRPYFSPGLPATSGRTSPTGCFASTRTRAWPCSSARRTRTPRRSAYGNRSSCTWISRRSSTSSSRASTSTPAT